MSTVESAQKVGGSSEPPAVIEGRLAADGVLVALVSDAPLGTYVVVSQWEAASCSMQYVRAQVRGEEYTGVCSTASGARFLGRNKAGRSAVSKAAHAARKANKAAAANPSVPTPSAAPARSPLDVEMAAIGAEVCRSVRRLTVRSLQMLDPELHAQYGRAKYRYGSEPSRSTKIEAYVLAFRLLMEHYYEPE